MSNWAAVADLAMREAQASVKLRVKEALSGAHANPVCTVENTTPSTLCQILDWRVRALLWPSSRPSGGWVHPGPGGKEPQRSDSHSEAVPPFLPVPQALRNLFETPAAPPLLAPLHLAPVEELCPQSPPCPSSSPTSLPLPPSHRVWSDQLLLAPSLGCHSDETPQKETSP